MAIPRRHPLLPSLLVMLGIEAVWLCVLLAHPNRMTLREVEGLIHGTATKVGAFYSSRGHFPENIGQALGSPGPAMDPWHHAIEFRVISEDRYELRSLGPDGQPGRGDIAGTFKVPAR